MTAALFLLAVGDRAALARLPQPALAAAGWTLRRATGREAGLAALAAGDIMALLLLDAGRAPGPAAALACALRDAESPAAMLPILAESDAPGAALPTPLAAAAVDLLVAAPVDAAAVSATWQAWQARQTAAADQRARLAARFGAAAFARLTAGLATQLRSALVQPDGVAAGEAHRIAGLAGTLGFAAASAAWLALSHGDPLARRRARLEARRALAAIAQEAG